MSESRMALGKRIQTLRQNAGLTQGVLAERAGLSLKHLGEIERGRGNPTLSSLESLANAFGIRLMELFDYDHELMSMQEIKKSVKSMITEANDEQYHVLYRLLRAWMK